MIRIRGGSGLGDSIYLRPIVEHFCGIDGDVTVASNYPDVFLGCAAKVTPFTRENINVLAHYSQRRQIQESKQFTDMCISAGIGCGLRFEWDIKNHALIEQLRANANGRPLIVVHGGRRPMGRTDGVGMELLPERDAFVDVLDSLDGCYTVMVGGEDQLYDLPVDLDLNGKTSVADLLDIAKSCDGVVAQCSFAVPMAEVFDKPLLVVWAAKGLQSQTFFVKHITPQKILSKHTSLSVMDNWPVEKIEEVVHAFRQL